MKKVTLSEKYRYRSGKKIFSPYIYVVIAIFFMIATTFSRYIKISNSNAILTIAKWNISVNNQNITSNNVPNIQVPILLENGSNAGIIRNGDTRLF